MKRKLGWVAAVLVALAMATPVTAHEAGTWIVRAGAGTVTPKSNSLDFGETFLADGSIVPDSIINVDDGSSLVLSATYMIKEHWAVDILPPSPTGC